MSPARSSLRFCPSSTSGSSRSTASSSAASTPGSPEPARSTSTFWRTIMYAITGITGNVGGALARTLLAERLPVRAVLRDEVKAAEWRTGGCDVALAEMDDPASLTSAFRGAAGVFILPPSEFDPEPGFPEARRVIAAVTAALAEARPGKVVCLSTIGADAPHENLLTQRALMEQSLEQIGLPVTFLRPGWFMENALWDVPSARDEGVLRSFLQPADKLFPMVATQDVGRLAAALLLEDWTGSRIIELEGPARVSPNDLARAFATVLERPVRVETVPRESWEQIFRSQGTQNPLPRIRMLDGFNEGWIEFSDYGRSAVKDTTTLDSVIAELVEASRAKAAAYHDRDFPPGLPTQPAARNGGGCVCPAAATSSKGHHHGINHHTG